jgi:hypothetical protein
MHSPIAYSLGLSAESRARRLRERILRSVEKDSKEGRPTRLPFLKHYLCGQDVPWSVQVRPAEFPKGTVLRAKSGFAPFQYAGFLDRIREFNRSGMLSGLQAVPQEMSGTKPLSFIVCQCPTEMVGDMLVSRVPEPFRKAPGLPGGLYLFTLHQAFVFTGLESDLAHECEHGVHLGIWHMTGFPIPVCASNAEYLSTLLELMYFDDPMILLRAMITNRESRARNPTGEPHLKASFRFIDRLKRRYGMSEDEIMRGMSYKETATETDRYLAKACGAAVECDPADAAHKEAILRYASREYGRTYEHIFGLPIKAIKEIIAGIQL